MRSEKVSGHVPVLIPELNNRSPPGANPLPLTAANKTSPSSFSLPPELFQMKLAEVPALKRSG